MKANELRIGNYLRWVTDPKIEITVNGVNSNTNHVLFMSTGFDGVIGLYHGDVKDYEPIPLTEEWLLKFGFEHFGTNKNRFWIDGLKFTYIRHQKNINLFTLNFSHAMTASAICEIQYVHQLQNLYFALTGEELTLTI